MTSSRNVLIVDLNNFARYPTMAVGYLTATLRKSGHRVSVFSPLMVGVRGVVREPRPTFYALFVAKLNHRLATSSRPWVRNWRDRLADGRRSGITAHHSQVVKATKQRIEELAPDIVLVSSYLMYRDVCADIGAVCRANGIPLVIGGPYFAQLEVVRSWLDLPGLAALIAGEVDLTIVEIIDSVVSERDPSVHPGVFVPSNAAEPKGSVAPPLRSLDDVPYPDYADFPWASYPNRIVPIITGRGCGWGVCTFCSDVTSSAGRTYRSRSLGNVLAEIRHHHEHHGVSHFVFTDLKLNSNLVMWRGLIDGLQECAPGSTWIGAVHVGPEQDNGLSAADLAAAARSGCVRLTTGLETGSQRIADVMKKGTKVERTSTFLRSARAAEISTRCTMIIGHPEETADDVGESADFLARHHDSIERVSVNRLQVVTGTALHRSGLRGALGSEIGPADPAMGKVELGGNAWNRRDHRRQVSRLLTEAHRINRRALLDRARDFEGVM